VKNLREAIFMAASKIWRAIVVGTLITVLMSALCGVLVFANSEATGYVFLALPFAVAVVTAWYVHAIDAMLISAALTTAAFLLIGWLCDYMEHLIIMLPMIGASLVGGAILGLLIRAYIRRLRAP